MPRLRRALKWGTLALLGAVLLTLGALVYLERFGPGQQLVLEYALKRVAESIEGTLRVERIRSAGLLRGARLYGVSVRGHDDRPLLDVDSIDVSYRVRAFLDGDIILSQLTFYGPHLTISRYPGEEDFNFDQILRSDDPAAAPDTTRTIRFNDVQLVDAFVEILLPVDAEDPPPERALTTTVAGMAGSFHHIYFESIHARIDDFILGAPGFVGPEAELRSVSLIGHVYEDPFTLTQLEGHVGWADGKLTVAAEELALPDTRASGVIVADFTEEGRGGRETGWAVDLQLESPHYALADLQWLMPQLPHGEGEGTFRVRLTDLGEVELAFSDATLEMERSRLAGEGTIRRKDGVRLERVRVRAAPLALAEMEAFTGDLPLAGTVEGEAVLDGTLERLHAEGEVTLREPGHEPTSGTFSGTFHLGDRRGVTDLVADLSELDYALLSVFMPASRIGGSGTAHVEATGRLEQGVSYRAQLVHGTPELPTSEIVAEGSFRMVGEELTLDVDADVSPLSLTTLRSFYPQLPVSGEVTGSIRATGPISDLAVTTDLETPAGRLAVDARFDARDPGAFYRVEGELGDFALSELVEQLPEPTVFNGYVRMEGRGTDPKTASIDAEIRARDTRIWDVRVDTARLLLRVREGVLYVDSADALAAGVQMAARGTMATYEEGPPGEIRVTFDAESLEGLRPILMEQNILVQDQLTQMQQDSLRAQGIDPDTLPTSDELQVGGRATGSVTLTGSIRRFSVMGSMTLGEVRYRTSSMYNAEVTFSAEGLPDFGSSMHARVVADSLDLAGRSFRRADAELDYVSPVGSVDLFLVRDDAEDYQARARFAMDSLGGGRVQLETLTLRFDSLRWELEHPGLFSWDDQAIRVANISLMQSGGGGVRVVGAGVLPREGEAAFALDIEGLELAQLVRLFQIEDVQMEGLLDLDIQIVGTADAPVITSTVDAAEVRYQNYAIDRVVGAVEYRNRQLIVDLEALENAERVLTMTGVIPAIVSFAEPAMRLPDEPIDLMVVADSLPAAFVAGVFPDLTDVQGTVAGRFDIGGTLDRPSPTGMLTLQNAAWTLESVGVRHQNVNGTLTLRPDGTVEVDARARADGEAHLTGSVRLAPLRNPTFDLQVSFGNFRAVDRRDAVGNVSGIIRLTGTFERPLIEGLAPAEGLRVESGVLYLEEFVRAATVVDLADPRFAEFVDLSLLETRILEESRNPFLQNLRVEVDLVVAQDTWLRSSDMDVEIAGDLRVSYDRATADIVLTGVLDARRGQYTVLGRRFQVREGQVEFLGIPGIDPNLNIGAETRVRMQSGDQLDITARVTGTLTEPRVALASDEAAISESDLVSYLLFGVPSFEISSGQRAVLGGAQAFVGTFALGSVATRLGSALAQPLGLDYFAITEVGSDVGSATQSQVELGRYVRQDLFFVLAFRPAQVVSTIGSTNPLGNFGLRLEYRPSPRFTFETFFEDRFLRTRALGFQDVALSNRRILGLFLFTEWGY